MRLDRNAAREALYEFIRGASLTNELDEEAVNDMVYIVLRTALGEEAWRNVR